MGFGVQGLSGKARSTTLMAFAASCGRRCPKWPALGSQMQVGGWIAARPKLSIYLLFLFSYIYIYIIIIYFILFFFLGGGRGGSES